MQNTNQVQNGSSSNIADDNNSNGNLSNVGLSTTLNQGQSGETQVSDNQITPQNNEGLSKQNMAYNSVSNPLPIQPVVVQAEKMYGLLSYLPFVHFITLVLKPESAFVRLHARQGILLFIIFFFSGIVAAIFSTFGLIGAILSFFIAFIPLATVILGVYSMYLAALGIWWKIPLLGAISEIIPIELFAKIVKENVTDQVLGVNKTNDEAQKVENGGSNNPPSSPLNS